MPTTLNTLDFLYLSLSFATILLVVVLTIAIVNIVLLIRDIRKISHTAGDITEKFHSMVLTPVNLVSKLVEQGSPYLEDFIASQIQKVKNKKNSKKKDS